MLNKNYQIPVSGCLLSGFPEQMTAGGFRPHSPAELLPGLKPQAQQNVLPGLPHAQQILYTKCPIINRYFRTGLSQGPYHMAPVALRKPASLKNCAVILPSTVCRGNSTLLA